VPHASWNPPDHCALAQALAIVGDAWDLLIVRDVTRGYRRFDQLARELGISRKVLTERLRKLEEHGLLARHAYQSAPARYEYRLTRRGAALVPVLVALQDWGDRWLFGDGTPTGLSTVDSQLRMRDLAGTVVPPVELPATIGDGLDVVDPQAKRTVLFGYPMTVSGSAPDGWASIPGAAGCTLENRLFRDRYPQFVKRKAVVRGVSTQRPDEQRAFAHSEGVPFALLSDADLLLASALRLPTFRAADVPRLRRFVLVIDAQRTVQSVLFPVTDIPAAVDWALAACR
jgi:DNA-binding HxlR family transcriptional regulator/peroxiredoxin